MQSAGQSAGPRLLLLPGMDGTGEFFARLVAALGGNATCIVASYPENATDTYKDHVRRIADGMGPDGCVILGKSFGGPIAVELAAARPAQVHGVILVATFLQSPWPPWIMRLAAFFSQGLAPPAVLRRSLIGGRDDPELSALIAKIVGDQPRSVAAQRLRQIASVDVREPFAGIRCPIRVLHGTDDHLVSHLPITAAARAKPGADVMLFDAPHMLLQTETAATARAVVDFMRRL